MAVFELVIALLFGGAVLAAVARRINAPYPALLALAGAALALLPDTPSVTLDPELALTLFVAPVLLDAAFDSSPRDLRKNWRPVTSLALTAVGLTVAAVAVAARWMVPDLSWPAAIALGAIVAPPDAAAATAVLKQLNPPHRILVILEGESLFNDASALLIYRLAVAAAVTGTFSAVGALPMLAGVTVGSVVLGAVLSRLMLWTTTRIQNVPTAVIIQFVSTFAVWMLAERLHLSGIITVVVFAILVARRAPQLIPARLRIPSYAVWEVVVFVLNVLAFILVGLQLKPIVARLDRPELLAYAATAAAVCAAVILVRVVWVLGYGLLSRLVRSRVQVPLRAAVVISWCGMRGIVTLAAALALPTEFPHRDLILFTAFCVVLVTLVVQGMTVSPLLCALGLEDDGEVEREVRLARAETAKAGLAAIAGAAPDHELLTLLRRKYEARHQRAAAATQEREPPPDDGMPEYAAAYERAQREERRRLAELRDDGTIGDDAFHKVEEELDWAEVNMEAVARSQ